MRTQGCSCVRMILPRNPNPNFDDFVFDFTCNAYVLGPFLYIHVVKLLFHMFNCLFPFHILELGFIFYFRALMSWTCIHIFMHNSIGTELLQGKWGKPCIYNVHAFLWWYDCTLNALGDNMIGLPCFYLDLMFICFCLRWDIMTWW